MTHPSSSHLLPFHFFGSVWVSNGLIFEFKIRKWVMNSNLPLNIRVLSSLTFIQEILECARAFGGHNEWGTTDTLWVGTRKAKCWALCRASHTKKCLAPNAKETMHLVIFFFFKPQDGNKHQESPERSVCWLKRNRKFQNVQTRKKIFLIENAEKLIHKPVHSNFHL